jgi:hypothetical protein
MVSGEGPASDRALRVLAGRRVDGTKLLRRRGISSCASVISVRCSEPRYSCDRHSGAHRFRGICSPAAFSLDSSGAVTFACVLLADWRPPCSLNVPSICSFFGQKVLFMPLLNATGGTRFTKLLINRFFRIEKHTKKKTNENPFLLCSIYIRFIENPFCESSLQPSLQVIASLNTRSTKVTET